MNDHIWHVAHEDGTAALLEADRVVGHGIAESDATVLAAVLNSAVRMAKTWPLRPLDDGSVGCAACHHPMALGGGRREHADGCPILIFQGLTNRA